ncbi:MAG: amphi-Trp domain-containing protein [gamma proteobacterium symbiont of Bathyaustriella thionipta]|nr:amphi-Trp domain-containing protein [gamma proteobacterium symbiont of Bathyaustriella thionipta]
MRKSQDSFRHESLQDAETIQNILKAISKGLARGKLSFGDEDGDIVMHPEGLLNLKVTASRDDSRQRVNIRITWQAEEKIKQKKPLSVNKTRCKQKSA